jgi:flagellar hook protein FlgE
MNEKWKTLKFNKNLQISNFGRLRTKKSGLVWKEMYDRSGYVSITLYHTQLKKSKSIKLHSLVAEYFIPKPDGKVQVNHKDFNKRNNHVDNLEWCTAKENVRHYFKNKFKYIISPDGVLFVRQNIESMGPAAVGKAVGISAGYAMNVANGRYFKDIHTEFIREKKPSEPVPVSMYDTESNFIKNFTSIKKCSKETGIKLSHIQRVLCGGRRSIRGLVFRSSGYKQVQRAKVGDSRKHKKVLKIDKNGVVVATYKNKSAAARAEGINLVTIKRAISGEAKTAIGFIWKCAD